MTINLHLPENVILKPCIAVFGVGGAGGNAVNNMISSNLEGVKFVVANTDAQALEYSLSERRLQLGEHITKGLGAGAAPEVGRAAAEESMEFILEHLEGSNMVFITAGMGGGTGTGAAPVIAKAAREKGILTVGVVTKPFHFEGSHRMRLAELGLQELQKYVDTLIVIPNQNLFRIANERTTFADAFKMADDVLHAGVRGVTDLMIMPGLINLDFADIRAVMSEMGKAMMGTGEAEGDKRALHAAEAAISNPLLDNVSMKGARGVLINITGGMDMTLFEVDEAANRIRDEVDPDANIIFGSTFNPDLSGRIRVSVVATGIDAQVPQAASDSQAGGGSVRPAVTTPAITAPATEKRPVETIAPAITTPVRHEVSATSQATGQHSLSKQFGLEEEWEVGLSSLGDDVFVAPAPAEPRAAVIAESASERAASPVTASRTEVRIESRTEEKTVEKEAARSGGGMSLFGRMAGSMRGKQQEEEQRASGKTEEEAGNREDILDIPAFLRRKTTTPVS